MIVVGESKRPPNAPLCPYLTLPRNQFHQPRPNRRAKPSSSWKPLQGFVDISALMASRDDRPFRPARHRITSSREHSDLYALAEKGSRHSMRFQASTAVPLSDRVETCAVVWNFFTFRMSQLYYEET